MHAIQKGLGDRDEFTTKWRVEARAKQKSRSKEGPARSRRTKTLQMMAPCRRRRRWFATMWTGCWRCRWGETRQADMGGQRVLTRTTTGEKIKEAHPRVHAVQDWTKVKGRLFAWSVLPGSARRRWRVRSRTDGKLRTLSWRRADEAEIRATAHVYRSPAHDHPDPRRRHAEAGLRLDETIRVDGFPGDPSAALLGFGSEQTPRSTTIPGSDYVCRLLFVCTEKYLHGIPLPLQDRRRSSSCRLHRFEKTRSPRDLGRSRARQRHRFRRGGAGRGVLE